MPENKIKYTETRFFSSLINAYLNQNKEIEHLYNNYPTIENFEKQIRQKQYSFTEESRKIVVKTIYNQYKNIQLSQNTKQNIDAILLNNTFTVTTGHQLNLFTGPVYFIYKIVSTINLCRELSEKYRQYNFVPIFWMASEDHDFEEINHFYCKESKISWHTNQKGAVGRFSTKEILNQKEKINQVFGKSENAKKLIQLFENAYNKESLAEATRFLVNELFKNTGLVIVDGNDIMLKKQFIPYIKKEFQSQMGYNYCKDVSQIDKHFRSQVNPRDINFFYLEENERKRMYKEGNDFKVQEKNISFTEKEIVDEIDNYPERFSPNVILRPLYQEVVLPNLCYIGGGGEIAYWLQIKSIFDEVSIPFPILLLRNSVMLYTRKQQLKMDKLSLSWKDIFLEEQELFNLKTKEYSKLPLNFLPLKNNLEKQFLELYELSKKTHFLFENALKAQEKKQLKGLENLEKKLLKAEKKQYQTQLESVVQLQKEFLPKGQLQERIVNFSEFYLLLGDSFIDLLINKLSPFDNTFTFIEV